MGFFSKVFGGSPGKDEFARLIMDSIRQAGEKATVRYDAAEFQLVADRGDNPQFLNLINGFNEYCAGSREQRGNVVRRFTRTWFAYLQEIPKDFADIQPDLLPSVRNRSYFEISKLQMQVQGLPPADWPYQPLAEHFGIGLVYDLPDSIMSIQQQTLTDWGVSFDEALAAARDNLGGMSQRSFERAAPGVWVSPWRDNHDCARLLLLDLIRQQKVKGDPVAMIPNRDTLLLTGADDPQGLAQLAVLAEKAREHPRPYSTVAVRLRGKTWTPFLPPPNHPQRQAFQMLCVQTFGQDYSDQAENLNALHQKNGDDTFVASFSAIQNKETGHIRSYCVWSEGVHGLLPRTDQVFLFRPKENEKGEVVATPSWERLQAVCGNLLTRVDIYPERYRVQRGFPNAEQLLALATEE
jgi:hypothetical protein